MAARGPWLVESRRWAQNGADCLVVRRLVVTAVAVGALSVSYHVARQRPVPRSELEMATRINDVPDAVAVALYPVMQLGNGLAPIAVGVGLAVWRRGWLLPVAATTAGVTAWLAAKAVKAAVERDRPLTYLPEVIVREGDGSGFGYISGHSAVAAAIGAVAMSALPLPARPAIPAAVGLVGVSRVVYGVHLPADVVGGWALGALLGLGATVIVDVVVLRSSAAHPG